MKNVFFILVIFFLCNTAGAYSDINQTQKDSVITVSFGTLSIESFLNTNTEGIFSESRLKILKGDTVMADNTSIHMIKLKDEFPWSIIDYEEVVIFKYYLSSHNILEAQVIKETTKKYLYRRSGEDIFPSFVKLLCLGIGLMIITFLVSLSYYPKKTSSQRILMPLFALIGWIIGSFIGSAFAFMGTRDMSFKLLCFIAGIYGVGMFITYRCGKLYLKGLLRKREAILQKA